MFRPNAEENVNEKFRQDLRFVKLCTTLPVFHNDKIRLSNHETISDNEQKN
jgi:hypothetical protein